MTYEESIRAKLKAIETTFSTLGLAEPVITVGQAIALIEQQEKELREFRESDLYCKGLEDGGRRVAMAG